MRRSATARLCSKSSRLKVTLDAHPVLMMAERSDAPKEPGRGAKGGTMALLRSTWDQTWSSRSAGLGRWWESSPRIGRLPWTHLPIGQLGTKMGQNNCEAAYHRDVSPHEDSFLKVSYRASPVVVSATAKSKTYHYRQWP